MKLRKFLGLEADEQVEKRKALKKIIAKLEKKAEGLRADIKAAESDKKQKKLKDKLSVNRQQRRKAKELLEELRNQG